MTAGGWSHDKVRTDLTNERQYTCIQVDTINARRQLEHTLALEARRADTPATYGPPTAQIFANARQAISDAQHAGDPQYAAFIFMQAAAELARYHHAWTVVRPPLGVRHEQDEAA